MVHRAETVTEAPASGWASGGGQSLPGYVTLATPSDVPMASFCNADLLRGNQPSGRLTTLSGYPLP